MAINNAEWLKVLKAEYLDSFIPGGGSAVKIGLIDTDSLDLLQGDIKASAESAGFLFAPVDAKVVRVDKIEEIFFAVTRQIDWDRIIDGWLRRLFHENGVVTDNNLPLSDLDALAEANGLDKPGLLNRLNRLVANAIGSDYRMVRDFRTALILLCTERYNKQDVSPSNAELIKQWLVGEKFSMGDLKKLMIYQKVNRHNARLLLISLAVWLHNTGISGLALLLNLNALVNEFPPEEAIRYARSRTLDVYEVLRQFIDDTDKMAYFLVVVVSDLLLETHPKRGFPEYEALRLRTMDDVHIDGQENPLNTLVRLNSEVADEIYHA